MLIARASTTILGFVLTPGKKPELTIRQAREADAERIAELSGQLGYPSSRENAVRRLAQIQNDPDHVVFVVETVTPAGATHLLGWMHAYVCDLLESDRTAEIGGLVVDRTMRRSGAGRLLMLRAEEWARQKGCRTVTLRSNVIRKDAHAFYESLGYAEIKTQKAFRKALDV